MIVDPPHHSFVLHHYHRHWENRALDWRRMRFKKRFHASSVFDLNGHPRVDSQCAGSSHTSNVNHRMTDLSIDVCSQPGRYTFDHCLLMNPPRRLGASKRPRLLLMILKRLYSPTTMALFGIKRTSARNARVAFTATSISSCLDWLLQSSAIWAR